jgi:hypothetical protein
VSDSITLNVPAGLEALYIVPTVKPLTDVDGAVEAAVKALEVPVAGAAAGLLSDESMTVSQNDAADFPPLPLDILRLFGATEDDTAAIAAATHLITIEAAYAPGWPPAGDWAARGVAARIAAEAGATVIDMSTPRVLTADAALATLPDTEGTIRLTKWVLVPHSVGEAGCWFSTTGLSRFGLPELQTFDVPVALEHLWGEVLSGIASHLLVAWSAQLRADPQATSVEIPAALTVTTIDIAQAFGERTVRDHAEATLWLRLDAGDDAPLITVLPPAGDERSTDDFYTAVCDALLGTAPDA